MKIYTAHVVTDSGDHYVWVYRSKPTTEAVIHRLWSSEQAEELEWYMNTTSVTISQTTIIE